MTRRFGEAVGGGAVKRPEGRAPGKTVVRRPWVCGSRERRLPSVWRVGWNFLLAVGRFFRVLAHGRRVFVEWRVREMRRRICEGCEWFRRSDQRCAHAGCGCRKYKRWLGSERCPVRKW